MDKNTGNKEKSVSLSKCLNKMKSSETESSRGSLKNIYYLNGFSTRKQGLFSVVGLSTNSVLCCQLGLEEICLQSGEMFLQTN